MFKFDKNKKNDIILIPKANNYMKDEQLRWASEQGQIVFSTDYLLTNDISLEDFKKYLDIIQVTQTPTIFNPINNY